MSGINFGSDMSRWMGPGLGGIMMGTQQRQAEETTALQQQRTLEEIARSKQRGEHDAVMNPMLQEQQRNVNLKAPVDLESAQLGNKEKQAKIDRDADAGFLNDFNQFYGNVPGADVELKKKYPKFANHEIWTAAGAAQQAGKLEDFKKQMVGSSTKQREADLTADRQLERDKQRDAAALIKAREVQELRNTGSLAVKTKEGEDKITIAREKAAAVQAKPTKENAEQLGSAAARASVAAQAILDDPNATQDQKVKATTDKRDADKLILFADQTLERVGAVRAAAAAAPKVDIPGLNRTGMQPVTPRTPIGGGTAPTPTPPAGAQAAPTQAAAPVDPRAAAMAAIAKGADRAAVAKRFKEATGQDL